MPSIRHVVALCAAALAPLACRSATAPQPDPGVRIVTSDIPNFWRAYDLAADKDSAERVRIYEDVYLRPGSPGLRDWTRSRLMEWTVVRRRLVTAGWRAPRIDSARRQTVGAPLRDSLERAIAPLAMHSGAEELVNAVATYPRYYAGVRATTLAVDTASVVTDVIRGGLRRLSKLYPEGHFPDIYFLIGRLTTGGTVGPSGMLMGTEQQAATPATPRDELPNWARVATTTQSFTTLGGLVLHEAVHTQQPQREPRNLLDAVLQEGIPDFISELAAGPWHAFSERATYGHAHEREVWLDFRDEMLSDSTVRTWMYNGNLAPPYNHGATDIGYWVGYRIAKSYYEHAPSKRAAIRELIQLSSPERILRESGYAAYAEALR